MKEIIILALLLICAGCSEQKQEENKTASKEQTQTKEPEKSKPLTVGSSAQSGSFTITLNSVTLIDSINEKGNEFAISKAGNGHVFAVVELTLQNATKEQQTFSTMTTDMKIKDSEGFSYQPDFGASIMSIAHQLDGTVSGGDKVRGKTAFKIKKGLKSLTFSMKGDITGELVTFEIPDKK